MDGVLKRLIAFNQVLLVAFTFCFLSFVGHHASTSALEVARDLEAVSHLKGGEADPLQLCATPGLQERLDATVQRSNDKLARVRTTLAAFLKDALGFDQDAIVRMKGGAPGLERNLFLVLPHLTSVTDDGGLCPLADPTTRNPRVTDTPDSVETILSRAQVVANSITVAYPDDWQPPPNPADVVPPLCRVWSDPSPTETPEMPMPAPPQPGAAPPVARTASGAGPASHALPARSPVPHAASATATSALSTASPPAASPSPRAATLRIVNHHVCTLAAIIFDGAKVRFYWVPNRGVQDALSPEDAPALAAHAASMRTDRPFLLDALTSVEPGWRKRIEEIGRSETRRRAIVERYGGLSIDGALQQSQKTYSDLVGSVALFGWNLLPEWFPLAVGGVLAAILSAILLTCRHARQLPGFGAKADKLQELDSIFFLSLAGPAGTAITWVLLPLLASILSAAYTRGVYRAADVVLGLVAAGIGALATAAFWREIPPSPPERPATAEPPSPSERPATAEPPSPSERPATAEPPFGRLRIRPRPQAPIRRAPHTKGVRFVNRS